MRLLSILGAWRRRYTPPVGTASDAELLRAWHEGDAKAGRELFERVFVPLERFFRSKVDHGVDDLIQSTLLVAVERSESLKDDNNFRAYLFTVARHEIFARLRQGAKEPDRFDSAVLSIEDLGTSPTGRLQKKRDREVLVLALRRIPIDFQIALELHYWEGLKAREIGDVLGIPTSTVTTRLGRARGLVSEHLQQLEGAASPVASASTELADWAAYARRAATSESDEE